MSADGVEIRVGAEERHRAAAAALYLRALHEKLAPFLGRGERGEILLRESLCLDRLIVAAREGELLGLAGFSHEGRGAFAPTLAGMWRVFGWSGGLRLLGLALLERSKSSEVLVMDGLAVMENARGQGIGSLLLDAVEAQARALGKSSVRLDVIDTNPRARRLYERRGWRAARTEKLGVFGWLFPFSEATEMRKDVDAKSGAELNAKIN